MLPNEKFKELIKEIIAPKMKAMNYKRKNSTFTICNEESNEGIINFQKSIKSASDLVYFTVNIGVCSNRLIQYFSPQRRKPDIWDCQFRIRIGELMEDKEDLWWIIDSKTEIETIGSTVGEAILAFGVTKIDEYISDTSLRDLWMTGHSPGLTKIERLMNLSVLIKDLGPVESLPQLVEEMTEILNRNRSPILAAHIERLKLS